MTIDDHRSEDTSNGPPGAALATAARSAETAIRQLVHLLTDERTLTSAEVDVVLAHLTSGLAALPQVAIRLGDALDRPRDAHAHICTARRERADGVPSERGVGRRRPRPEERQPPTSPTSRARGPAR